VTHHPNTTLPLQGSIRDRDGAGWRILGLGAGLGRADSPVRAVPASTLATGNILRSALLAALLATATLSSAAAQSGAAATPQVAVPQAAAPHVANQQQGAAKAPEQDPFTREEFDKLVKSIVHYPDALLAQVLPASAYPLEIVQAARWLHRNKAAAAKGDFAAADAMNWDSSVKSLLLCRMSSAS
jgi:hypothetical protein